MDDTRLCYRGKCNDTKNNMALSMLRRMYTSRPVLANMAIYGSLYFAGDLSRQTIMADSKLYDLTSSSKMAMFGGGVVAPMVFHVYRILDRKLPGTTLKVICKKVLFDQGVMGLVGTVLFYTGKTSGGFRGGALGARAPPGHDQIHFVALFKSFKTRSSLPTVHFLSLAQLHP